MLEFHPPHRHQRCMPEAVHTPDRIAKALTDSSFEGEAGFALKCGRQTLSQ